MSYIQQFFTSRDNNANAETFVGQEGRLWWDPVTNQIYSSDGNTPGGIPLSGGGGATNKIYNGTSYANIANADGNVVVGADGNTWIFGTDGTLTLPGANTDYTITTQDGYITVGNLLAVNLVINNIRSDDSSFVNIEDGINVTGEILATANITGSYFLGNGSQLTGIDATSIQNGTSNVRVVSSGGNVTVGVGGTGNVAVFNTGGMSVTANVTGGNLITAGAISAASVSASGNITGGNVIVGNLVFSTDTISSQDGTITIDPAAVGVTGLVIIQGNLQVNGNTTTINSNVVSTNDLTYNLANNAINSAAANGGGIEVGPIGSPYITWLYNSTAGGWETAQGISATGNITGSYFLGNGSQLTGIDATSIQNGTSNVRVVSSGGNVTVSVGGTSNVAVFDSTGEYVTGLISATGNITGGNLSVGTGTLSGGNIVNTNANGVGNIGSSTVYYNTVFAKATSAQYADLAEWYEADANYPPGTVLVFGGSAEVTVANSPGDTRIAGVVSTNPAYNMNSGLKAPHVAAVALTGRVPTKVTGSVSKGDMMIAAGNGAAMACSTPVVGTVIGKALENFDGESGVIEVVVGVR